MDSFNHDMLVYLLRPVSIKVQLNPSQYWRNKLSINAKPMGTIYWLWMSHRDTSTLNRLSQVQLGDNLFCIFIKYNNNLILDRRWLPFLCRKLPWRMKNEVWRMKNEEWRMKNEEWRIKNEEWRMKNEEWRMKIVMFDRI